MGFLVFGFFLPLAAIEALKNGSMRPSAPSARPVLEQFIPLENDAGGSEGVGEKPKDERRCTTSSPKLVDTAENSSSSSSFDLNENPKAELQTEVFQEPKEVSGTTCLVQIMLIDELRLDSVRFICCAALDC